MSAMFLAMVWHARRRVAAMRAPPKARAAQQERFLHDVSHELRTPVTIARGHLELLAARRATARELAVALDELAGSSGSSPACCCSPRPDSRSCSPPPTSRPTRSSRTCSCAGRRWRPARWRLGPLVAGHVSPTRKLCGSRSTRCSRTPSSTPSRTRRSSCARCGLDFDLVLEVADGGRVSRPSASTGSSTASPAATTRGRARAAASAWVSRSSTRSRTRTAARAR